MMERAVIVDALGKALIWRAGALKIWSAGGSGELRDSFPGEFAQIQDIGAETYELPPRRLALPEVEREVDVRYRGHQALDFFLAVLDRVLDRETRLESAEIAEAEVADESAFRFVRNRLLSRGLPDEADIDGALGLVAPDNLPMVAGLLADLRDSQPAIRHCGDAWTEMATHLDGDTNPEAACRELADLGVWSACVDAVREGRRSDLSAIVLKFGQEPRLADHLRQPAKFLARLARRIGGNPPDRTTMPPMEAEAEAEVRTESVADPILNLIYRSSDRWDQDEKLA